MRVVFVAGFFAPVENALKETFADHLSAGSIVWVRQVGPGRELNINEFKMRFFDKLAKGNKEVLIVMAVLRGREWTEDTIRSITEGAQRDYPGTNIRLSVNRNAQDSEGVLNEIGAFGLPPLFGVSMDQIAKKLNGQKVLCVVQEGHVGFALSLERAGFPAGAFAEHFEELKVQRGKNSNLISLLEEKSKSFDHLLYAWSGLRTLPPGVKKKFSGVHCEAASSHEVVALFKRWIVGTPTA